MAIKGNDDFFVIRAIRQIRGCFFCFCFWPVNGYLKMPGRRITITQHGFGQKETKQKMRCKKKHPKNKKR